MDGVKAVEVVVPMELHRFGFRFCLGLDWGGGGGGGGGGVDIK